MVSEKVNDKTDNNTNLDSNVKCCPHCKSKHYVKNGFNPNHKQKYLYKECKKVFFQQQKLYFQEVESRIAIGQVLLLVKLMD